jgi:zinc transporter 1/2/3
MELIASKVAVLILFGLLKFITGLAPSILLKRLRVHGKKKRWLEKAMGGVLCVGGGVLLATVFVHMLPEVRESLKTAQNQFQKSQHEDEHNHSHDAHEKDHEDHHSYPFAELVTCAGFFVIYFVEAIVHRIFKGTHGVGSHGHSHGIPQGMIKEKNTSQENKDDSNDSGSTDHEKYAISTPKSSSADSGVDNPGFRIENEGLGYVDINEMTSNGTINKEENGVTSTDGNEKFSNMAGVRLTSPTNAAIQPEHPDSTVWIKSPFGKKYKTQQSDGKDIGGTALSGITGRSNVYNVSSATLTSYTTYQNNEGEQSLDEASLPNHYGLPTVDKEIKETINIGKERKVLFSVRNFLIVLALSVHSIFEGMAIGLQLTVQDVWKLFLAVSLHDVPVHFCVGMEMFNGGIKKLHIITYFLILGIITPVGIIIGIVVTEHAGEGGNGTQTMVIGVLQGLAGGTLLYIAFYEVLDREKLAKAGMTGILGCVLLTCGFAFMAALEAAGGHSHGVIQNKHDHSKHGHLDHDHAMHDMHVQESTEQPFKTLQDGIAKHGGHGHQHSPEDHHHTHDHNHREPLAHISDDFDLEKEIHGLYSHAEENEHNSSIQSGTNEQNKAVHEEHDHFDEDDRHEIDHEHDQDHHEEHDHFDEDDHHEMDHEHEHEHDHKHEHEHDNEHEHDHHEDEKIH